VKSVTASKEVEVRQRSFLLTLLGLGLVGGAALSATNQAWLLGAILLASGVVCLQLSVVRVTASPDGLEVVVGYIPWPSIRIDGREVAEVERRPVSVGKAGGWGYRGNWTILKRVVISLGGSSGLYVRTTSDQHLQVSMPAARADEIVRALGGAGTHP
jgi:hypothetical protein